MKFHETKQVSSMLDVFHISFGMGDLKLITHSDNEIVTRSIVEKEGYKPYLKGDINHCILRPIQKSYGFSDRGKLNTWDVFIPEKIRFITNLKFNIAFTKALVDLTPIEAGKINLSTSKGNVEIDVAAKEFIISSHKSRIIVILRDQIQKVNISAVSSDVVLQLCKKLHPVVNKSGICNEVVIADFDNGFAVPISLSGIGNKLKITHVDKE